MTRIRDPSLNAVFDVLSAEPRRRLLTDLAEGTDDLTAIPDDLGPTTEDEQRRIVRMTHVHLPKLEAAGFVEWDRRANVVTRGPRFEEVIPAVRSVRERRSEGSNG